jgi:hypothetical protein
MKYTKLNDLFSVQKFIDENFLIKKASLRMWQRNGYILNQAQINVIIALIFTDRIKFEQVANKGNFRIIVTIVLNDYMPVALLSLLKLKGIAPSAPYIFNDSKIVFRSRCLPWPVRLTEFYTTFFINGEWDYKALINKMTEQIVYEWGFYRDECAFFYCGDTMYLKLKELRELFDDKLDVYMKLESDCLMASMWDLPWFNSKRMVAYEIIKF